MSMQLSSRQNLFYHTLQLSLWNPIPFHTHGPRRRRTAYATRIKMILIVLDFSNSQYHIYKIMCGHNLVQCTELIYSFPPQKLFTSRISLSSRVVPYTTSPVLTSLQDREGLEPFRFRTVIHLLSPVTRGSFWHFSFLKWRAFPLIRSKFIILCISAAHSSDRITLSAANRDKDIFIYRNQYFHPYKRKIMICFRE